LIGRIGAPAVCIAVLAAPTAVAASLPSGVHVDSGSPAGTEYAIPLSQARGGHTGNRSQLFGVGISKAPTPVQTGAATTPGNESPGAVAPRRRERTGSVPSPSAPESKSARTLVAQQTNGLAAVTSRVLGSRGASGLVWMLLTAGAVLLIGTLIGLALGQRGRRRAAGAG
jgi:hypothetical protein